MEHMIIVSSKICIENLVLGWPSATILVNSSYPIGLGEYYYIKKGCW